ncbi:hypothetical protein [Nocardia yamanashiensis]|uniref:hypothetical protein n=1 Tax=Nocardia yamanashiensis TaxID=209247 RepID=UPI000AE4BF27|nr:hypothetical protein [Nocardia yamanashiensis]
MPLISAAMCPHPTMLIPDVAGKASGEWDKLRSACTESIRQLRIPVYNPSGGSITPAGDEPDLVVIVGGDHKTTTFDPSGAYGSLLAHGICWEYGWEGAGEAQPLPLSLTLGYWLMLTGKGNGMMTADVAFQAIAIDASPPECMRLGKELAGRAEKVAMLVMGEGSTCMTAAERRRDPNRARRYDAEVTRALAHADSEALARLDPRGFRMTATGRAAWQVLAGAAIGHRFQGRLHSSPTRRDQYFVASWNRHPEIPGR